MATLDRDDRPADADSSSLVRALRRSEERLHLALEAGRLGPWEWDVRSGAVYWSSTLERLHGLEPGDFAGDFQAFQRDIHPDDRERVLETIRRTVEERRRDYRVEYRIVKPDGEIAWLEARGRLLLDEGGEPVSMIGVCSDVTERRRAEEKLRQTEALLSGLVESATAAIFVKDAEGRYTLVNRWCERLWGMSREEIVGKTDYELFRREIAEQLRADDAEVMRSGEPREFEEATEFGDGVHVFLTSKVPLLDAAGKAYALCGVATDVTRLKEVEAALREETRALETVNRIGRSLAAELDFERLLQLTVDAATEITGAKFGAFFYNRIDEQGEAYQLYTLSGAPREAFSRFPMPRATSLFGPTFRGEAVIRIVDVLADPRYGHNPPYHGMPKGHLPVRSYLAAPVVSRSGEVLGGLFFGHPEPGVFSDRSERTLAGIAAQVAVAVDNARLYEEAQSELAERRRAEAALIEADRHKDEFLAMLGHELRNPLAPIRNCLTMLGENGLAGEVAERARRMMERQVRHLSRLVDDLLDISRVSQGRILLRKSNLDLVELVRATVEDHRPSLEEQGLVLEVRLPAGTLPVRGDATRLAQALGNLLHNAGKFTDPGGTVAVALEKAEAGLARLTVRDTGVGIEPQLLPNLFVPFTGAPTDLARSRGGMGLGLALVQRLVDLHGGRVEASSEGVGQGSEFTLWIPLLTGEEPDLQESVMKDNAGVGSPRRILVIEDQPDAAESMSLLLEIKGHQVRVAEDGPSALAEARRFRPEVVLCDIGLPGEMDGYALARAFRKETDLASARLIALTGYGREEDRRQAREAGFDHHMTKPVDMEVLEDLLARQ